MSAPTAVFPDLWLGGADSALLSPWVTGSLLPSVPSCKPHRFGSSFALDRPFSQPELMWRQMRHNFNWDGEKLDPATCNSCSPGSRPGWTWVGEDSPSQRKSEEEAQRKSREDVPSGFLLVPRSWAFQGPAASLPLASMSFCSTQTLKCRLRSNWFPQIPVTCN